MAIFNEGYNSLNLSWQFSKSCIIVFDNIAQSIFYEASMGQDRRSLVSLMFTFHTIGIVDLFLPQ